MAIERAIVTGHILNAVTTKNMFTAEVIEVGGDTSPILWEAYFFTLVPAIAELAAPLVTLETYEIQRWTGTQWQTTGFFDLDFTPANTTGQIPNSMALVLIGKALGVRRMGRKFIGGLDLTTVAGNILVGPAAANAVLLLAAYLSPVIGLVGGTLQPGIKAGDGNFHPFVGGFVSQFLGTMRRRKPGVGI